MMLIELIWSWIVGAVVAVLGLFGAAAGSLEYQGYVEGEYVRVGLPAAGTLDRLVVARGDKIAPGAPLFTLDATAERAAQEEAAARLEQAVSGLENLKKGRRAPELDMILAQKAQAEAMLRLSEVELRRQEQLLQTRVVSQERVDNARAEHQRNRARVDEVVASLQTARMAARDDEIAAASAAADAAARALDQAKWRLEQREANAPVAALVADTLYRQGEFVPAGAPVVSLLPPGNIKLRFFVPERDLGRIAVGQRFDLACDGCPTGLGAVVTFIAPNAEFTPPVIYSNQRREKLVFLIEARPLPDPARFHPGQPVTLRSVP